MTSLLTLSGLLARWRKHPAWEEAMQAGREYPPLAGAVVASAIAPQLGPQAINLGALYSRWWLADRRTVWVVEPETAALVADTGVGFLPPEAPASWSGGALLVEGRNGGLLVDDVFSLGVYVAPSQTTGQPWYWFVTLHAPDGCGVFGLPCDQGRVNARLARQGQLSDLRMVPGGEWEGLGQGRPYTPAEQERWLRVVQWAFAFSFFAGSGGEWWHVGPAGQGPPVRDARGKVLKKRGMPVPLWTYRTLVVASDPPTDDAEPGEAQGPLDTSGLDLRPSLVRAHWRRTVPGADPKLIGSYAARRWRRTIGDRVRV